MKKTVQALTRSELKFWLPIIGMAVAGSIAYATLRAEVVAQAQFDEDLVEREQMNRGQFQDFTNSMTETVGEIKDTVIRIDTNQGHIMRELGINQ